MNGDSLQRIAAAVTPAVMVSACGLIALGLDNQASRMSMRLRELMREFREEVPPGGRRALLRAQVAVMSRRHAILAKALLLNYGSLFAFVVTSLLSLAQGIFALPAEIPLVTFAAGVLMLAAMAAFAIASVNLARVALRMEEAEVLGVEDSTPTKP